MRGHPEARRQAPAWAGRRRAWSLAGGSPQCPDRAVAPPALAHRAWSLAGGSPQRPLAVSRGWKRGRALGCTRARVLRRLLPALAAAWAAVGAAEELQGLGAIHFPTSASGPAQEHFLRGVTILHSFGWKQARQEFQAAQRAAPGFAMAHWGEALCYNHPLIAEWDRDTPREVLKRLGDTPAERLAKAPTERERGFLAATEALFFGAGDTLARRRAYAAAMAELHDAFPEDDEVAAFRALSLLMSAGPAGTGQRANVLAGAIALALLAKNPRHPGAAHYAIHAFDDPIHAPLALPAADVFADIAEKVSHARHMPSHIYIQRGMWDKVSASNQSAYEAAVDVWVPGDMVGDMVHALDWGQYGDLQRGDYQRARQWIERMEGVLEKADGHAWAVAALPRVRARLAIETESGRTWPVTDAAAAPELLATGLGAARRGDASLAAAAAARLGELAEAGAANDGDGFEYLWNSSALAIMHREVAAVAAIAEGDVEAGLALLAEGVEVAESMRPPSGAPHPLKPVHELYGEALLAAGRAEQALAMFERSLGRTPNRPLSLRGLARAQAALGDGPAARATYRRLADGWRGRETPWGAEAQAFLAGGGEGSARPSG